MWKTPEQRPHLILSCACSILFVVKRQYCSLHRDSFVIGRVRGVMVDNTIHLQTENERVKEREGEREKERGSKSKKG